MKDNMKRLLAFVLAAVMLVSLCPTLGPVSYTHLPPAISGSHRKLMKVSAASLF